ncbi:uncharacterized protein MONOS_11295 [Monocercomonoides exilis]|uniref:uncharacterized protein n=1 Tax=Monocercomonoides exilis TaxID=2049356 RepID=UPI0035598A59|nr:hypothetical protein MONOS_11295 [Monocercomonoides exilis]|eukprot:MONOS_11295.1-p1 / transcript=MONOS_11295.1 / gene=MONOS_11295 / organism=Monocercomonoides_exilis_PA203 / gene_product=unspecified product / transcript_product=unspecified product / location=Mono_scaffold00559:29723-35299(-) / protein_length=1757 / sequence_SO=supercontig / SO=protein_coding / is_pseudo=false
MSVTPEQLKEAFALFQNPGPTHKQIEEQLKVFRRSDCWNVCATILMEQINEKNQSVALFCGGCCQEFVTLHWTKINGERKDQIRHFLWNYVENRISGPNAVPSNLFKMMNKVLVDVIKQDFPDIDSTLFDRLFQLICKSCPTFSAIVGSQTLEPFSFDISPLLQKPEPIVVVFSIFSELMQELCDSKHSNMTTFRLKRFVSCLLSGEHSLNFSKLLKFIEVTLTTYCSNMKSKTAPPQHPFVMSFTSFFPHISTNQSSLNIHTKLLLAALEILRGCVKLITPFTSYNTPLPQALFAALPLCTYIPAEHRLAITLPQNGSAGAPPSSAAAAGLTFTQYLDVSLDSPQWPAEGVVNEADCIGETTLELLCELTRTTQVESLFVTHILPLCSFLTQTVHWLPESYFSRAMYALNEIFETQLKLANNKNETLDVVANEVLPRLMELATRLSGRMPTSALKSSLPEFSLPPPSSNPSLTPDSPFVSPAAPWLLLFPESSRTRGTGREIDAAVCPARYASCLSVIESARAQLTDIKEDPPLSLTQKFQSPMTSSPLAASSSSASASSASSAGSSSLSIDPSLAAAGYGGISEATIRTYAVINPLLYKFCPALFTLSGLSLAVPSFAQNAQIASCLIADHMRTDTIAKVTASSSQYPPGMAPVDGALSLNPLFLGVAQLNAQCSVVPSIARDDIASGSSSFGASSAESRTIVFASLSAQIHSSIFAPPPGESSHQKTNWHYVYDSSLFSLSNPVELLPRHFFRLFARFIVAQLQKAAQHFKTDNFLLSAVSSSPSPSSSFFSQSAAAMPSSSSSSPSSGAYEATFAVLSDCCLALSVLLTIAPPFYPFISENTPTEFIGDTASSSASSSSSPSSDSLPTLANDLPLNNPHALSLVTREAHIEFLAQTLGISQLLGAAMASLINVLASSSSSPSSSPSSSSSSSPSSHPPFAFTPQNIRLLAMVSECVCLCLDCLSSLGCSLLYTHSQKLYTEAQQHLQELSYQSGGVQPPQNMAPIHPTATFDGPAFVSKLLEICLIFLQLSSSLSSAINTQTTTNQSLAALVSTVTSGGSVSPSSVFLPQTLLLACSLMSPCFIHATLLFESLSRAHCHPALFAIPQLQSFLVPAISSLFTFSSPASTLLSAFHPLYIHRHKLLESVVWSLLQPPRVRPAPIKQPSPVTPVNPELQLQLISFLFNAPLAPFDLLWSMVADSAVAKMPDALRPLCESALSLSREVLQAISSLSSSSASSASVAGGSSSSPSSAGASGAAAFYEGSFALLSHPAAGYSSRFPDSPLPVALDEPLLASINELSWLATLSFRGTPQLRTAIFEQIFRRRVIPLLHLTAVAFETPAAMQFCLRSAVALPRAFGTILSAFAPILTPPVINTALSLLSTATGAVECLSSPSAGQAAPAGTPQSASAALQSRLCQHLMVSTQPISALIRMFLSLLITPSSDYTQLLEPSLRIALQCMEICTGVSQRYAIQKATEEAQAAQSAASPSPQSVGAPTALQAIPINTLSPSSTFCQETIELLTNVLYYHMQKIQPQLLRDVFAGLVQLIDPIVDVPVPAAAPGLPTTRALYLPSPSPALIKNVCVCFIRCADHNRLFSTKFWADANLSERTLSVLLSLVIGEGADAKHDSLIEVIQLVLAGIARKKVEDEEKAQSAGVGAGGAPSAALGFPPPPPSPTVVSKQQQMEMQVLQWWSTTVVPNTLLRMEENAFRDKYLERIRIDLDQIYVPNSLDYPTFRASVEAVMNDARCTKKRS